MKHTIKGIQMLVLALALLLGQVGAAVALPDGQSRVAPDGAAPAAPTASIVVNTTADNTTAGDGFCTLREAINNAQYDNDTTTGDCIAGSGDDAITFASAIAGGTIPLGGTPLNYLFAPVGTSLSINGAAAGMTIDGSNASGVFMLGGGVELSNLTIRRGSAVDGAGINSSFNTLVLNNVTFMDNNASGNGSAIHARYSTVTINNSTLSGNTSGLGGAIYHDSYSMTINHSTIIGNITTDPSGGGGLEMGGGTTTIKNSILAGNSNAGGPNNVVKAVGATLASHGYNLESGTEAGFTAEGDLQNTDPNLLPLADNGGPTWTHAFGATSPAHNQIPMFVNGCGSTTLDDQRGHPRPLDAACDMGAFEGATITILVDLDDGHTAPVGNWNTISNANRNSTQANLIDFDSGLATGISYSGAGWSGNESVEIIWNAGDKDWVLDDAADDAFYTASSGASSITLSGLTGDSYSVELVAAMQISGIADYTVEGGFADCSANRTYGVNGENFHVRDDGSAPGNWLIWEQVTPDGGEIVISIDASAGTYGFANAIRLREGAGNICPEEIRLDLADLHAAPLGNWNTIPAASQNGNVYNLIDYTSGTATGVFYYGSDWYYVFGNETTWTAGDSGWVLDDAADDAFGTANGGSATLALIGLTGSSYSVELVSASPGSGEVADYKVDGEFADCNANGAPGVNGDDFDANADGTVPGNWLTWENVAPMYGQIVISVDASSGTYGDVSAVRVRETSEVVCPEEILLDLHDAHAAPVGNWNTISETHKNDYVNNLIDFNSGLETEIDYAGLYWGDSLGANETIWNAGDKGWLLDNAADDGFSTSQNNLAYINFQGLAGVSYSVELVVASFYDGAVADFTVGDSFADCNYNNTPGVTGDNFDAKADGSVPGNWLIWDKVAPENGTIAIKINSSQGTYGDVVAARLRKDTGAVCPEMDVQRLPNTSLGDGAIDDLGVRSQSLTVLEYTIDNSAGGTALVIPAGGVTASNLVNSRSFVAISALPQTIPAGGKFAFQVGFTVDDPGLFSLDIDIASNDGDEHPYSLILRGFGPGTKQIFLPMVIK